jgi:benzoyl-CoA 2,3-dioxygenase component B
MAAHAKTVSTFGDWVDLFHEWRKDIGYDESLMDKFDFEFEAKYGELPTNEIEFGDFAGHHRWDRVIEIPDQRIRDALLTLIVYQGDTEFASVEQQKNLVETAPSDYDLYSLVRINAEEMRHGWQMCHVLVDHFGEQGKREAVKLLERRAWNRERLLGSFNEDVDNWLDFFVYTNFVDRDGKFQLNMLSTSAFSPLARSMGPMLKEEAFHLGTGNAGLKRVVQAGVVPHHIIQRYLNKWLSTAYDLFGTDHSGSAQWGYVWGVKGRYDERKTREVEDLDKNALNENARAKYMAEVDQVVQTLNKVRPEGWDEFRIPDLKYNRRIGDYGGQRFSVRGEDLDAAAFAAHLEETLPREEDKVYMRELMKTKDWIAPPTQSIK